ncbi:28115_t:CDS:2 [Gigaspora margarita]|uniref:28115_t:CDS:1 n=1 Tax=Gigaspora margarita TaxID=4874 RepID=A0ABN7VV86_GIGMA|nr:28115_t:CDS:2 [Gigaspora margarita]
MNDKTLEYKEKQDDLSQKGSLEMNNLFCSDFCQEEHTLIATDLSGIELKKRLTKLLNNNQNMPLKDFIKGASLINQKGHWLSNSLPAYNHQRRREFIDFLKSKFDFIESGDKMIIIPKTREGKSGITFLQNLSKVEFIRYPYFWNLINNCKEGHECKLAFCQKCNPEFETLFNEQHKKQIHEILINPPAKENIVYYPQVGSDYVLKKFYEKFKGKENEHNIIVHWD